ncbi:hypothetical protein PUN28_005825 [Cardiocondyla obscurior]|uniref:Uncharacterized protein n=1 Tax=Cardiocondyla obscurior TaxID=286306 RepID=A0AAW2G862_9HYME
MNRAHLFKLLACLPANGRRAEGFSVRLSRPRQAEHPCRSEFARTARRYAKCTRGRRSPRRSGRDTFACKLRSRSRQIKRANRGTAFTGTRVTRCVGARKIRKQRVVICISCILLISYIEISITSREAHLSKCRSLP